MNKRNAERSLAARTSLMFWAGIITTIVTHDFRWAIAGTSCFLMLILIATYVPD